MGISLPRIVAVGIYNSQLVAKNKAVSKNRKTTMFELELPMESGGVSYIDKVSHPIEEDLVILAKPGQLRHTSFPFKCYYVHMIVTEGELYDTLVDLPDFTEISDIERVKEIFAKMCEVYNDGALKNELILNSLIFELAYIIYRSSSGSRAGVGFKRSNRSIIEETIEYINNNLTSELSLKLLAGRANFTETYFHKLFRASTGKNLREYIEDQRIKKSIDLMLSTDMTLTEISYECGFSSQSYFSYAFKRNTGATPRAYVKRISEIYNE